MQGRKGGQIEGILPNNKESFCSAPALSKKIPAATEPLLKTLEFLTKTCHVNWSDDNCSSL